MLIYKLSALLILHALTAFILYGSIHFHTPSNIGAFNCDLQMSLHRVIISSRQLVLDKH